MYAAVHVRDDLHEGDYLTIELDKEDDNELHLHLSSDIYMTVSKEEWERIVEKVAEATFGKW
jgi:hypothetical protein